MFSRFRHSLTVLGVVAVGSAVGSIGVPGRVAAPSQPFSGTPTELTAPDGVGGDDFGWATAASGSTAVVGAYGDDAGVGAAYVFAGAPWSQQVELQATGGQPGDDFGKAVAVDGETAAIGAPGSVSGTGAVYIFGDSGGSWTQEAELTASDGQVGDSFGDALVLSGTTLIIGAPGRDSSAGAAYVFTGAGATWSQEAELTAPDAAAGDGFASAVALSGSTAVFGAPQAGTGGAAYVFSGAGTTWSEQAELSEGVSASTGDTFGFAVGLTGSTALIGAPGRTDATGTVYVFSSAGGSWTQQATLAGSGAKTGYKFGISLAVSNATALIGASNHGPYHGAVYAFTQSGGNWQQSADFKPAGQKQRGNLFGESVALSGTTAVVGAYRSTQYLGAGYVFVQGTTPSTWTQSADLLASDGQAQGDFMGASSALSGTTLVVGAPQHNDYQGAAYIYTLKGSIWSLAAELSDPGATDGDTFGSAVAISGSTVLIGAPGKAAAAYVYDQSGSTWSLQATLTPTGGTSDNFGHAVAVSGSTAVIGGSDVVYVFASAGAIWSQDQELTQPDATGKDRYGFAVGVSSSALVIGAPGYDSQAGIAYFYGLNGSTWTLQSELAGSDPAGGDVYGTTIAVSGTTAILGAPGTNNAQHINGRTGTAYVFVQAGGTWSQQAEIKPSGLHNGQVYGDVVAASSTGNTVAVSAPGGTVWVFANAAGTWSQIQVLSSMPLTPIAASDPIFGSSLAVSDSTLAVGASGANSRAGAAFVYARGGTPITVH
jgi:hypothetical protein